LLLLLLQFKFSLEFGVVYFILSALVAISNKKGWVKGGGGKNETESRNKYFLKGQRTITFFFFLKNPLPISLTRVPLEDDNEAAGHRGD
jgi:hypothetical protein